MIAAIYLSYNPDIEVLNCSVQSALRECDIVFIYDNASEDNLSLSINNNPRVNIVNGRENIGVGGLNILAELAISQGAKYLIILDQDSMLPEGYVFKTLQYLEKREAIVCPTYSDRERGISSRYYNSRSFFRASFEVNQGTVEYVRTDFAIGSGMILSSRIWRRLNGLNEDFFLDCADIDICFRAIKQEIPIFLDTKSIMEHSIGNGFINVFGIKVSNHTPFRHYLYYKNIISLVFCEFSPIQWKIRTIIKLLFQAVIYSLFSPKKNLNVKAFFYAIRHSIFQRLPTKDLMSKMVKVLR